MLTGKQRSYLRSLSNTLSPIFQVGKGGITEELAFQIGNALEARELIKITVLETSGFTAREVADILAEATASDVVSVSGRKLVLYRPSEKKPTIELPR